MVFTVAALGLHAAVQAVSASSTSDPWPMFMRTASHDASTTAAVLATATAPSLLSNLQEAWVYNTSHVVSSSPTLIGDLVLAASGCGPDPCAGGELVALHRANGTTKWSTPMGSGIAYSSPMPSKDHSLVYIGTDAGKVVAVNVAHGEVVHSYTTGANITSTPCVAPDGSVYIGSYDNNLYKFDAQLKLVWKFATQGEVWGSPAISDDGALVFVGSVDKGIYGVHTDSGKLAWLHNTTGRIKSSPVFHDKQVLIGSFEDKCMRALDAKTGKEAWRFTSQDFIFSSPAITTTTNGTSVVVVTGSDSFVYGVERNTGSLLWKVKTGSYIDASPAIIGHHAVVASYDGVVYAIDVDTGVVVSKFGGMAGSESSAAIGHDGIYVGSSDGGVRRLK